MAKAERPVPYDREAEMSAIGAALLSPDAFSKMSRIVTGNDFHLKAHRLIWRAMDRAADRHALVDATTVLGELREAGELEDAGGGAYLIDAQERCPAPSAGPTYAATVRELSHRRRVIQRTGEIAASAHEGNGYRDIVGQMVKDITNFDRGLQLPDDLIDLWELCEQDFPDYDWLIEGLLERQGRVILFGEEGIGKSLLTLQALVQAACGLPVLGRWRTPRPLDVLYLDLEIPRRSVRRRGLGFLKRLELEPKHGVRSVPYFSRQSGLDLHSVSGKATLMRMVEGTKPDLVVIDPVYKLFSGDILYEKDVKPVLTFLDEIREEFNCGLWLVHHPRKSIDAGYTRGSVASDMFGASVLLRWPELILVHMEGSITVKKTRDEYFTRDQQIAVSKGVLEVKAGGRWTFEANDGPVLGKLHHEILEYLIKAGEPMSGAKIAESIGGRRQSVYDGLRALVMATKLRTLPPPSGKGHPWYTVA